MKRQRFIPLLHEGMEVARLERIASRPGYWSMRCRLFTEDPAMTISLTKGRKRLELSCGYVLEEGRFVKDAGAYLRKMENKEKEGWILTFSNN